MIADARPASRADQLCQRAWFYLATARELRTLADQATSHGEAAFLLFCCRENVRFARWANHQSLEARTRQPARWSPPALRPLRVHPARTVVVRQAVAEGGE